MEQKEKDYQFYLTQIISMIRDKSTYLKTIDKNSGSYNQNHYEGMADAYFFVLDGIKTYIECNEDLTLEEFGLDNYNPVEIFDYKPIE